MGNQFSDGLPIEFESQICVFPNSSDEVSSIGTEDIIELVDKKTKRKLLGKNKDTHIYKYTNIQTVELNERFIQIGQSFQIDYNDVINVEILSEKGLGVHLMSQSCQYMRLIVAKYDCPYCDSHTDFISSLSKHIKDRHNKKPNTTEIKEQRRHLFYIYLIGEAEFAKGGLNNHVEINNAPDFSKHTFEKVAQKINQKSANLEEDLEVLLDWIEKPGELRIEGLEKGSSTTRGTISGSTESKGVSRGIQVGPFTREKSKSQGSIDAKIESSTSDNTFSSDIDFLQIDKDGIYAESDPIINVRYLDIDRVAKRKNGIYAEIGQQTYSMNGYGHFGTSPLKEHNLSKAFAIIENKVNASNKLEESSKEMDKNNSEQTPTEKIKELKKLYDDGIISEEEFESKKKELLDKF